MMKQVTIKLPFRMFALIVGLFLSMGAFAQIDVKGHVKDATGEPIIGATIRVVGTQTATVSDFDGNFGLKANPGADLSVTYVGYQTATVKAAPNVVVTLQDDAALLENVVVIGYGRAKKSDLTGSVTAIKPDDMNHGLQTNAQDMLQGKIAGVQVTSNDGAPGGGATIRIRGGSSLNASNDPLIVIDGLAMDNFGVQGLANPLSMVNPNDIESFTVLKDASATAIYGSRASNGVIIITTKKGKTGQKPQISYNGNVSVSVKKNTVDVMDGPQFTQFVKDLYGEASDAYRALGWYDDEGNQHFANTDWQDEIYQTAVSTDHNLTITGGLKNMPYRVSLGATVNNGIVKTSSFNRYTASVNLSPTLLNDHLKFNINGKGMFAENRYPGDAIGNAVRMDPTKPVTANTAIYNKYFGGYAQWYKSGTVEGEDGWSYLPNTNGTRNPVAALSNKEDKAYSRTLVGNIEVDYAIHGFEDLHIHANGGMDLSSGNQYTTYSPYEVNSTSSDENAKPINYYGYYGKQIKKTYNLSFNAYAQYIKELGINHFDIMAGYEWQHFHQDYDKTWLQTVPMSNTINPGAVFNEPTTETNYKAEYYLVSFFGRLNYTLADRYLLTFTLRDDGSSRFPKDNRWGLFPSAAFAWKINEEGFLKNASWLSDAKLRLGWGITGQQEGINYYDYIPTYTPNLSGAYYDLGLNSGNTYRPDGYNKDLTWEKTTTYNAGIDLGFANNRITLAVDWYYRKTTDLLNNVYVSAGSNFKNKQMTNIGSLHNTGIEFATTVRPIQTNDLRWELNYNFTYNHNEIDELNAADNGPSGDNIDASNQIKVNKEGKAADSFYPYMQVYDQQGMPIFNLFVDRDGNGTLGSNDRYYYYKPTPDVTMGFGNKVIYKSWDFSFSMRASLGNYVFNNISRGFMDTSKGSVYQNEFLENRMVDLVPLKFQDATEQRLSDYWIENASFLKLDNITLGYSFSHLFDANISGRVYGTVQNVWTWTKYSGLDPEINGGIDNNMYPRPFTTVLGLNLNF